MSIQFIAPTKRRKMTKARAAAIFLREQGRCYVCSRQLRIGVDPYQIEHPDPLCLGGSDDDADLRVICTDCHKPKTKLDAAAKAKRDRLVTASYRPEGERRSTWPKAPKRKAPPQRSASKAMSDKFSNLRRPQEEPLA